MTTPFVFDWVAAHASSNGDAPAIGTPNHGWSSYQQLHDSIVVSAGLLDDAGATSDDFVVQALPPSAVSVAIGIAVQVVGATCVEINPELDRRGVEEILRQTAARIVVIAGRDVRRWIDVLAAAEVDRVLVVHPVTPPAAMVTALEGLRWTWIPEAFEELIAVGERGPLAARDHDPERAALLVYTSGSTGVPRAVVQTHANIDANTRAIVRYLRLSERDRAMATLPLFYCYGRSVLQTHLLVGGSVFFDHRFMYPSVVMEEVGVQRCTGFAGVPLTFENLRRAVDVAAMDLADLRYVTQAGGRMRTETIDWVREVFAPAELFVMYGQTEATSRLSFLPPGRAIDKRGSVGCGLDNVELRVVEPSGRPLPAGEQGNVVARGPSITPGYFRAPDETSEILREGWLWTGDLGYLDEDGFLFLTGRESEFLKLDGNRVSAREIEDAIARHPAVAEAAVAGMSDANGSEQAVAFVVPAPSAAPDEEQLRRFCRASMPAFKVPRFVRVVDHLPLTASGKIARAELNEWIKNDASLFEGRPPARSGADGS